MSINSAMLAGTAGMLANSSVMSAISDNIANVNTVGYKALKSDFTAMLDPQAGQSTYNAGGVVSSSRALLTDQGSTQASTVATSMAITGTGFFVVRQRGADASATDPYYYTRAGQFAPDATGYLKNTAGYYLEGWPVDAAGKVASSPTNLAALQPIKVTDIAGSAQATTSVALSANLQSSQAVSAAAATYDATNPANDMSSGAVTPDFQTPVQIYDSEGGVHSLTMSFLKKGPNQWYAEVSLPSGEVASPITDGQIAAGVVSFTPFGQIDTANTTLPSSITINNNGSAAAGPQWASSLGLASQTIGLNIGGPGSAGGLTGYDTASTLGTTTVNGTAFGSLAAVDVDTNGFVTATFTNGLTRKIFQVPVATFGNENGLTQQIGGAYALSPDAGTVTLRGAGLSGAGDIKSHTLEASTVDLASEFSNLIMTQRAYSASSKIITTADQMLDELIRMKQ